MKKKEAKELQFISKEMKKNNSMNDDNKKIISFIVVLAIVGILIGVLFFVNAKFVTKDYFQDDTTTTTKEAEYDDSLLTVDTIFSKKDEYYVFAYDFKDKSSKDIYESLVAYYDDENIKLYVIDLSLKMNSSYYNKNEKEVIKKDEFNFNGPTIIRIKNGKIVKYTTDRDEIVKILNNK